jgi:hypothetical protein
MWYTVNLDLTHPVVGATFMAPASAMLNIAKIGHANDGRHEYFLASCLSVASTGARWQDE